MITLNDISNAKVVLYPHRPMAHDKTKQTDPATRAYSQATPQDPNELDTVRVVGRTTIETHTVDDLLLGRSNIGSFYDDTRLEASEGLTNIDVSEQVSVLTVTKLLTPPYENVNISLTITPQDLHLLTVGKANNAATVNSRSVLGSVKHLRNLCTGAWLAINTTDDSNKNMAFFGKVTSINVNSMMTASGVPVYSVSLTAMSFYYPLMTNEIKQTLSRDESIQGLDESAFFRSADYNYGLLRQLIADFSLSEDVPVANLLYNIIKTLTTYRLPNIAPAVNVLGDVITILDGSASDMQRVGLYGSDANVIKGKILASYQGSNTNNITHDNFLRQMFQPLPEIMELYATCVPYEDGMLVADKDFSKATGVVPVIVYRYRPVDPLVPPSAEGIANLLKKRKGGGAVVVNNKTKSEEFFGDFDIFNVNAIHLIDSNLVTAFEYTADDSGHVNYVFCEQAFSNGQAQNYNFARNHVRPSLDKTDINRHGLRSFSTSVPFLARGDKEDMKRRNLAAAEAIAERLFHTIGMGHQFLNGSITLAGVVDYIPVGTWFTVSNLITDESDDVEFRGYITGVTVVQAGDVVTRATTTITFTRGHYGVHAPLFDYEYTLKPEVDLNFNYQKILDGNRRLS
jgi:hypothetical protein